MFPGEVILNYMAHVAAKQDPRLSALHPVPSDGTAQITRVVSVFITVYGTVLFSCNTPQACIVPSLVQHQMRDALFLLAVAATRALPVEYWAGGELRGEEVRVEVYPWRTLFGVAHLQSRCTSIPGRLTGIERGACASPLVSLVSLSP